MRDVFFRELEKQSYTVQQKTSVKILHKLARLCVFVHSSCEFLKECHLCALFALVCFHSCPFLIFSHYPLMATTKCNVSNIDHWLTLSSQVVGDTLGFGHNDNRVRPRVEPSSSKIAETTKLFTLSFVLSV